MPTAITAANLIARANLLLNEDTQTSLYTLQSGTNATPTMNAATGATRLLNDAKDFLCRHVMPIPGAFTASYGAAQYWERYDAFAPVADGTSGSTTTTGAKLWWAQRASVSGTALEYVGEEILRSYHPDYETVQSTNLTPFSLFFRRDQRGIGIYPVPAATVTVKAEGFYIPADMTADGSGSLDWCDAALAQMLVLDLAVRAISKDAANANLAQHAMSLMAERDALLLATWAELPAYLRVGPDAPMKTPPVTMSGSAKGK